jgi:hypothetical protein
MPHDIAKLLSDREQVALPVYWRNSRRYLFRTEPIIGALMSRELVEAENGFLRLTSLDETVVAALPLPPERRP